MYYNESLKRSTSWQYAFVRSPAKLGKKKLEFAPYERGENCLTIRMLFSCIFDNPSRRKFPLSLLPPSPDTPMADMYGFMTSFLPPPRCPEPHHVSWPRAHGLLTSRRHISVPLSSLLPGLDSKKNVKSNTGLKQSHRTHTLAFFPILPRCARLGKKKQLSLKMNLSWPLST